MNFNKIRAKQVMSLAWPAIVSNITVPLLSLVDMAIVGHLPSVTAIGAVAVGGTAFNMIYWLFGFLRMGTSGMTAQAYGKGDDKVASLVLYRALFIGVASSAVLLVLSLFLAEDGLALIDPDKATLSQATSYFMILIWGAPAVLSTYALSGWFLGMQNSKMQMIMALVTNVSNILISLTLVYGFGLGIEGCAIGTLTAQWLGVLTGFSALVKRYRLPKVPLHLVLEHRGLIKFLKINIFIFLRTVCLVAVTLWFTHAGASFGQMVLSANAVLLQFFMLFSYFLDGFGFASEALIGRYYGASDSKSITSVIKTSLGLGLIISLCFTVVYVAGGDIILQLLTDKHQVINTAEEYLPWVFTIPLAGMSAFIYDGVFIGMTLTKQMFISMLAASLIYFICYFALAPFIGNHALWLAFILYLALRGGGEALILHRRINVKSAH